MELALFNRRGVLRKCVAPSLRGLNIAVGFHGPASWALRLGESAENGAKKKMSLKRQ